MSWTDAVKIALTVGEARGVKYRVFGRRDRAGWYYIAKPVTR